MPNTKFLKLEHAYMRVIKRFPLVYMLAIVGAGLGIYLSKQAEHFENVETIEHFYATVLMIVIAIPLTLAIALFAEHRSVRKTTSLLFQGVGIALSIAFLIALPQPDDMLLKHTILYTSVLVACCVAVGIAPFLIKSKEEQFWKYIHALVIRAISTGIFTGAIILGVILALLLVNHLFNTSLDEETYLCVVLFIFGIFGSAMFLSGIPTKQQREKDTKYSKALRIFSMYILAPLSSTYAIVLYIYFFRIIITSEWPMSSVAYLVIALAAFGFITIALLTPQTNRSKLCKWYIKIFSVSIIPLAGMLFWSIGRRVSEYGLTENRYYVIIIGIWVVVVGTLFVIRKHIHLKNVVLSIGIIALITAIGPWGSSSMSLRNQTNRLRTLLEEQNIFVDETITPGQEVNFHKRKEISGILDYLEDTGQLETIDPWFTEVRTTAADSLKRNNRSFVFMELMGLEYVSIWNTGSENMRSRSFYIENFDRNGPFRSMDISKYDTFFDFELYVTTEGYDKEFYPGTPYHLELTEGGTLGLIDNDTRAILIDVGSLVKQLDQEAKDEYSNYVSPEKMIIETSNEHVQVQTYITYVSAEVPADSTKPVSMTTLEGRMLIKNLR